MSSGVRGVSLGSMSFFSTRRDRRNNLSAYTQAATAKDSDAPIVTACLRVLPVAMLETFLQRSIINDGK
eukprot:scaffold5961_cov75-Skeletonema_menzelii.AAC.1